MPNFSGPAGSIHPRRFVHILIHTCNRCQIYDGVPADRFPDMAPEHDLVEITRFHHVEDAAISTEEADDLIQ